MDTWLIGALVAWVLYSVAVAASSVIRVPGFDTAADSLVEWGWLVAPALLIAGGLAAVRRHWTGELRPGAHVVYMMPKWSTHPSPRARHVYAAPHGEGYSYVVPKLWTVIDQAHDGMVEVVTPGGKRREVEVTDPRLHKASVIESLVLRLRLHKHFPALEEAA